MTRHHCLSPGYFGWTTATRYCEIPPVRAHRRGGCEARRELPPGAQHRRRRAAALAVVAGDRADLRGDRRSRVRWFDALIAPPRRTRPASSRGSARSPAAARARSRPPSRARRTRPSPAPWPTRRTCGWPGPSTGRSRSPSTTVRARTRCGCSRCSTATTYPRPSSRWESRSSTSTPARRPSSPTGIRSETTPRPTRPMSKLPASTQQQQLLQETAAIGDYGAPFPRMFSPPYGLWNSTTLALLKKYKMLMILWTVDTSDYELPGAQVDRRPGARRRQAGRDHPHARRRWRTAPRRSRPCPRSSRVCAPRATSWSPCPGCCWTTRRPRTRTWPRWSGPGG